MQQACYDDIKHLIWVFVVLNVYYDFLAIAVARMKTEFIYLLQRHMLHLKKLNVFCVFFLNKKFSMAKIIKKDRDIGHGQPFCP